MKMIPLTPSHFLQSCIQQQGLGPAASALLHHRDDREDGEHQQEVQIHLCVWWQEAALRLPRPLYGPAVPGET